MSQYYPVHWKGATSMEVSLLGTEDDGSSPVQNEEMDSSTKVTQRFTPRERVQQRITEQIVYVPVSRVMKERERRRENCGSHRSARSPSSLSHV